jgi:kynurenine formamidase
VPRIVDLSATIEPSSSELPQLLRTDIAYEVHAAGAETIASMFGVGRELLRNGEGWANETFTRLGTHNSTHVDAPWHYNSSVEGARAQSIDELPLEWFLGPGVVLDMTHKADGDAMTVADAGAALDAAGHELSPGEIVLVRTGRDEFYGRPEYMGLGPGVTAEATQWLCDRGIRVMGVDAWGWDAPLYLQAEEAKRSAQPGIFWAAHQCDRVYCQIERLVNLGSLPATGFTVACFPLKVKRGSAGPARVVAIFDS